eukprot:340468_1
MSLAGKTVAFTGEMVGMTRKEASAIAQAAGAMIGSSGSKNIDFLFAGNGATPAKTLKAQQNGIHVLPAPQFSQMTAGFKAAAPVAPVMAAPVAVAVAPVAQPTFVQPMQFVPYVAATQPVFSHQAVALPGKKVCFTGSFESGNRAQVGELAEQEGAMVHAHVQADTDILVCGISAHETKLAAAKQMGIRCVTEQQFTAAARPAAPVYAAPVAQPAAPMMAAAPRVRAPRTIAAPLPAAPVNAAPIMLAGQNVVFTGALQVNRVVAATMVTKAGGMPQPTLTAKTNLLVCGANAGPKMAKAQAMGVRCINEAEFVGACQF